MRLENQYGLKAEMVTEEPPHREVDDPDMKATGSAPMPRLMKEDCKISRNRSTPE